jgi:hypothetical protein
MMRQNYAIADMIEHGGGCDNTLSKDVGDLLHVETTWNKPHPCLRDAIVLLLHRYLSRMSRKRAGAQPK